MLRFSVAFAVVVSAAFGGMASLITVVSVSALGVGFLKSFHLVFIAVITLSNESLRFIPLDIVVAAILATVDIPVMAFPICDVPNNVSTAPLQVLK